MTLCTIQLLRFIAAFLVLLFHLNLLDSGYKGVDIFFVISGFVMYMQLFAHNRPKAFVFVVNRLTKIFFLYWLTLILCYLINPFPVNITLLNSIFLFAPGKPLVLNPAWTLTYELYFYFLIGVIAYLLPDTYFTKAFFFLLLVTTVFTLYSLVNKVHIKGFSFLIGNHTWEFLLGILSGLLSGKIFRSASGNMLLSITLLSLSLLFLINIPPRVSPLPAVIYGLLSMSLIFFMTAWEEKILIPANIAAIFKISGNASYAIYLFGPLVTMLIPRHHALSKVIIIIVTIVISIFFNLVIEVNVLRWSRKMIYRLL